MAKIIDGKAVAKAVREDVAKEVAALKQRGIAPGLAVIIVGDDPASQVYVKNKEKDCEEVGFFSEKFALPASATQEELLDLVRRLNGREDIHGILCQLPLPKGLDDSAVIEAIDPRKDVDGFHPLNVGRMVAGLPAYISATPAGILELLKYYKIETAGKHCVVVGRSNIVGRPMANLLSQKGWDCTVTICHSRTRDLPSVVAQGDIVIAAIGKAEFITAAMVKPGAVVIDVGITRVPSDKTKSGWKLLGDVKFDEVAPKCSYITPVPGGVGLMTVVALMDNTLKAARKEIFP